MPYTFNPFEIENQRQNLIELKKNIPYFHLSILQYNNYFISVLSTNNEHLAEAFISDVLSDYKLAVHKYEVYGTDPEYTKTIIDQLKVISSLKRFFNKIDFLDSEIIRIENELNKLTNILDGKIFNEIPKINFPLVYKPTTEHFFGIIDSIKVRINKSTNENQILIVPSEKEIEEQIINQCRNSWELAVRISKKYVNKIDPFHEVIVSFTKRIGAYEGNSLGIALTISFLQQILQFYNPAYVISLKEKIGFTGGVSSTGIVLSMGDEIIKRKINLVFYSNLELFVIPKTEENAAVEELKKLKETYPNRNLKIIPTEEFNEVLLRRDLIDIKKQKVFKRSLKFIKKHSVGTFSIILFLTLFSYLFFIDLDDNPAILDISLNTLFVKNKSGKILWTKNMNYNSAISNLRLLKTRQLLADINGDSINEIILSNENYDDIKNVKEKNRIVCFDKDKNIIWKYNFRDPVIANSGPIDTFYGTNLADTITINNKKTLFCTALNSNSFASAVFQLDIKTGKRVNGTLWNSGHIISVNFKDFNNDGKKDLICAFFNNGYEKVGVLTIEVAKLNGKCPSTFKYSIKNMPEAELINYILLPKSDYCQYANQRMEGLDIDNLLDYKEQEIINIKVFVEEPKINYSYHIHYNLKDFDIIIGNEFRVKRDSLVVHDKLNPPLTDTEEYCNLLKSQIKYWNGKDFVFLKDN